MEREFRDEGIERMPQEELEVTLSHGIGPDEELGSGSLEGLRKRGEGSVSGSFRRHRIRGLKAIASHCCDAMEEFYRRIAGKRKLWSLED